MCRALGSSRTREKEPCDRVLSLPCGFHKDGHSCVYVLMGFSSNQDTRFVKAESLMQKVFAEGNQLTDFKGQSG